MGQSMATVPQYTRAMDAGMASSHGMMNALAQRAMIAATAQCRTLALLQLRATIATTEHCTRLTAAQTCARTARLTATALQHMMGTGATKDNWNTVTPAAQPPARNKTARMEHPTGIAPARIRATDAGTASSTSTRNAVQAVETVLMEQRMAIVQPLTQVIGATMVS